MTARSAGCSWRRIGTAADVPYQSFGHEVKLRRRKVREGDGVLTMEQVHWLVAHVRDPYKPTVWLLVFAGLRPAELCGLRVRDVDFVRHTVSVRATLMPVHGYGDEPWRMVEGSPKTDAGDRTIPVPPWLCDDLAAMLAARGDGDRDAWLFQTRQRNPLHRDHFREGVIRPALRAAGLPETIRTYDLRHSHASFELGANRSQSRNGWATATPASRSGSTGTSSKAPK